MSKESTGVRFRSVMDATQKRRAIFAEFMKRSTVPQFINDAEMSDQDSIDAPDEKEEPLQAAGN